MRYEIHFKGWNNGWSYDHTYEENEINKEDYEWELNDFIHWYFDDISEDDIRYMLNKEGDCFITYIVYNAKDEVIYEIGFWEKEEGKNYLTEDNKEDVI